MRYLLIISVFVLVKFSGLAQLKQGFIEVNDGRLFYELSGTGQAIVFLHGMCLDHRMWQKQVEYFSDSYTCVNIDLRGFGQSSVPGSTAYSFHEDIKTVLDSLKITNPAVFIALSMGGRAAVNFSLAYPERTKGLVLADAVIDGYTFTDFKMSFFSEVAKLEGINAANKSFLDHKLFSSVRENTSVFDRFREMVLSYSGWHWVNKNPVQFLSPPAIQRLAEIEVPVLIITGEKDIPDFQKAAAIVHEGISQSVKKQIAAAGHMCNMEKPELFNSLVSDFLISCK
jgi:3-oxoadipate enol-lactonase